MNLVKRLLLGVAVLLAAVAFLCLVTPLGQTLNAAIEMHNPLPVYWYDNTSSNAFGLSSAGVPRVTIDGLNYSGITSNRAFLGGTGVTNTMVIKNGIITAIE